MSYSDNAIEFRQVVKKFGTVTAVDHVSLNIRDGEFFSLLGPSGCGKTTSLRMIAGFEEPTAGEILIENRSQAGLPPHKRPVNTVFQNYALFPHMTVYQNVSFGLEMEKMRNSERSQRVKSVLEMVRLPEMEKRRPRQLSGGQQQRVALARALVKQPKVLLLDEPLGALDLKLRKAMQVELKNLQHRVGITFVYVTHDQEEALTMSDRIAVMDQGVIQQVGSPEDIYERPANRFVADFIGETNFIPVEITSPGSPVLVSTAGGVKLPAEQTSQDLHPGEEAYISIRPEKIQLFPLQNPEPVISQKTACLPGRVLQTIYLGTDTRYLIELIDGIQITARLQNMNGHDFRFSPGDPVEVHWEAHHTRLLKA